MVRQRWLVYGLVGCMGIGMGDSFSFATTPLRKIVTIQAMSASLSNVINREFISDSTLFGDIVSNHSHIQVDVFYTSVLAFTLFVEHYYWQKNWDNIELYKSQRKTITVALTFLFFLLTRNVGSAS